MSQCYNQSMNRLWPLPILLLLALPLAAQEGDEAAPAADAAPADAGAEPAEPAVAPEPPPVDEAQPSENADAGDGAAPSKEEPVVSVKLTAPSGDENDGESVAPLVEKTKVVPTATLIKPMKKGKKSAGKGSKIAKAKKSLTPAVVVAAKPVIAPEPPPPPVPAVPLTPITPRNP